MEENKQIELRSEKVRNIIGQVPPVLLRYGITIIGLSLLTLVIIAAIVPYQPCIETKVTVIQDTAGTLHFTANIPQEAMKKKTQFVNITTSPESELPLPEHFRIDSIFGTVQITQNGVYYTAFITATDTLSNHVQLGSSITLPAKIKLEKQRILKWIFAKIISAK